MRRLFLVISLCAILVLLAATALVWSGLSDRIGTADVALILGNTVNPDGTPSPRLKARLDTAIRFFNQGCFKLIIVSGGTGKEGVPEGTAMKIYLVKQGIPADSIIVDDNGVDTYASAKNTKGILLQRNLQRVFVITQYFHIPRSRVALAKFGIAPVFSGHAAYFEWRDIYSTLRELPAYVKYYMKRDFDRALVDSPQTIK